MVKTKHRKHRSVSFLALLLTLFPFLVPDVGSGQEVSTSFYYGAIQYDLDSASTIYCVGGPKYVQSPLSIKADGTATVTNMNAGEIPFAPIAAGDVLIIRTPAAGGTDLFRRITAKASDASITVDSNVTAGNYPWFYIHFVCGTGANDGWMPIGSYGRGATIVFELNQSNTTTGTDVIWQCRTSVLGAQPVQVFPASGVKTYLNAAAADPAAGRTAVVVNEPWSQCRVGLKLNTTDDGGDTGANAEQINVYVLGRK